MIVKKLSRSEIRKLVEAYIRDESGNLVKMSDEDSLKYFQNSARGATPIITPSPSSGSSSSPTVINKKNEVST